MAYNSLNLKQAGWFYHAPAKRKNAPPVGVPPPSQIPGLNGVLQSPEEEGSKVTWIKDTDSPYVVLAKQGGRSDLLRMRTPKPPSEEPRGYPRCDWFYLEDNAIEDAQNNPENQSNEDYQFLLPTYMVHQPRKTRAPLNEAGAAQDGHTPKRSVFHFDDKTAFDREENPTDKTQKIPEMRPPGCGVRLARDNPAQHSAQTPERGHARQPEYQGQEKKYTPVFTPDETNPTDMSKVMAFGYQQDWEDKRSEWNDKQNKYAQHHKSPNGFQTTSEYQSGYKGTPPASGTSRHSNHRQKSSTPHDKNGAHQQEPFKMSKFKNISSRVDSQRPLAGT